MRLGKRADASEQLIQKHPIAPPVCVERVPSLLDHLRRPVPWRARAATHRLVPNGVRRVSGEHCESQVRNFGVAIILQQHIFRLEVPVQDPEVVQVLEAKQYFGRKKARAFNPKPFPEGSQVECKVSSGAQRKTEVEIRGVHEAVAQGHAERRWLVAEFFQNFKLGLDHLENFLAFDELAVHTLERHHLAGHAVPRSRDDTKRTTSEVAEYDKVIHRDLPVSVP
mmetsp:Transcript_26726/g.85056  ORF Transcript_26726/g.85056 Transcript_26726/m.85056 type:complete len:224 (-) Transcript_26726:84-755(-)